MFIFDFSFLFLQVKSQDGHYFLAGIISWGIGCKLSEGKIILVQRGKFNGLKGIEFFLKIFFSLKIEN